MSAWGFSDDDYGNQDLVLILPDNLEAVNLFIDLSTQWRVGASGASGLDYNVLFQMLNMHRVPKKKWASLIDDIQVMEGQALETMSEK